GGIGIALGMAVDADIVALEASHRRLETVAPAATDDDRRAKLLAAAQAFAPAILTSLLITALSFLPVLAFTGETGRLLRPLAITKTIVVIAAAIVTLTLAPALPVATRLGGEFLPRIDEGDLLYMPTTLPGVPPEQAAFQLYWQDHAMSQFGEVETVFGKVGRADTGTDPAPYAMAETIVRLRPRAEWPKLPRRRWYSAWAPA